MLVQSATHCCVRHARSCVGSVRATGVAAAVAVSRGVLPRHYNSNSRHSSAPSYPDSRYNPSSSSSSSSPSFSSSSSNDYSSPAPSPSYRTGSDRESKSDFYQEYDPYAGTRSNSPPHSSYSPSPAPARSSSSQYSAPHSAWNAPAPYSSSASVPSYSYGPSTPSPRNNDFPSSGGYHPHQQQQQRIEVDRAALLDMMEKLMAHSAGNRSPRPNSYSPRHSSPYSSSDSSASRFSRASSPSSSSFRSSSMRRSPYIYPNLAWQWMKEGKTVIGTMIAEFRQISSPQIMRNAGFDFVIFDNEHGMFSNESLSDLCRVSRFLGISPIVRVPAHDYHLAAQSLDGGAQGIVFPRIENRRQVEELVQICRYPPVGKRGNAMYRGYSDWKGGNVVDAMATHNDETCLIFQVETREAMEDLEGILSVPGVDGTLVGPNDLSIALGSPGDWNSPLMQQAMAEVVTLCNKHGVIPGIHVSDTAQSLEYAAKGYRLLSANSEVGFMQTAALAHVKQIKNKLGPQSTVDQSIPGEEEQGSY